VNSIYSQIKVDTLTQSLINKLIGKVIYFTETNGWSGYMPQYYAFETFKTKVPSKDLKKLLYHSDKYIRAYSFLTLTNRNDTDLYLFIRENICDTSVISMMWGDEGSSKTLGQFYEQKGAKYITSKNEKNEIDSIIMYKRGSIPLRLESKYDAFCNNASKNLYMDSILWIGWEKYNIIKLNGLNYFLVKDKQRTFNNIERYFYDTSFCNTKSGYTLCALHEKELLRKIISINLQSNPEKTKAQIISHLKETLPFRTEELELVLLKILAKLNNSELNNELLAILKQIQDPGVYATTIDFYRDNMKSEFKTQTRSDILSILIEDVWGENDLVALKLRYKYVDIKK
jgi:hypothetical protein